MSVVEALEDEVRFCIVGIDRANIVLQELYCLPNLSPGRPWHRRDASHRDSQIMMGQAFVAMLVRKPKNVIALLKHNFKLATQGAVVHQSRKLKDRKVIVFPV